MQTDRLGESKIRWVAEYGYRCRLSIDYPSQGYPTHASVVTFDAIVAIAGQEFTGTIWVRFEGRPKVAAAEGHASIVIFLEKQGVIGGRCLIAFDIENKVFGTSRTASDRPVFMKNDGFAPIDGGDMIELYGE